MKKIGSKTIWVTVVATIVLAFSGSIQAGITSSAHDFQSLGWSGGEICVPCHTPHRADTSVTSSPLWNHDVTASTFTLYSSTTLDSTPGQPNGHSKLCLSCHDGSVALDSFGGATGTTFVTGNYLVGTDLSGSHPVSITYDTALATLDGGLYDPATQTSGLGGTIATDMLFNTGSVECTGCHDVHDGAGNDDLLWIDNAGSALCLTCHDK